jgi:hypothetical protein
MTPRLLAALGLVLLAACDAAPEPTTSSAAPAGSTASEEAWTPVAGFLGGDDEADEEIRALLGGEGIESDAYGSLGYTVSVRTEDAPAARTLLRDAIAKGLRAGVVELDR